jgi:asparagine synthase (glutamine-hydrolysing)
MRLIDQLSYLPDDILVKVDRAAMAVSLGDAGATARSPGRGVLVGLPLSQLLRPGQSKRLLRQVLCKHVPRALIERPKQGFAVPLAAWLRGPLREWAEELLSDSALRQGGYLAGGRQA